MDRPGLPFDKFIFRPPGGLLELRDTTSDTLSLDIRSSVFDFNSFKISSTPTGAGIFRVPLLNTADLSGMSETPLAF